MDAKVIEMKIIKYYIIQVICYMSDSPTCGRTKTFFEAIK